MVVQTPCAPPHVLDCHCFFGFPMLQGLGTFGEGAALLAQTVLLPRLQQFFFFFHSFLLLSVYLWLE